MRSGCPPPLQAFAVCYPHAEKIQHLDVDELVSSKFLNGLERGMRSEEVTPMEHDHHIGQVRHRARLSSRERRRSPSGRGSKRLRSASAKTPIGTSLPNYRKASVITKMAPVPIGGDWRALWAEFIERVARREGVRKRDAAFHARCVLEVVDEATTGAPVTRVKEELPDEFPPIFEAGSQGEMRTN
jgi:uncharacterized protein (DUF2267 family)